MQKRNAKSKFVVGCIWLSFSSAVYAQTPENSTPPLPPPAPEPPTKPIAEDPIIVAGERPRGSVNTDVPPTLTYNALALKTYGADNVEELINALGPTVKSARVGENGSPVVLLNGRRVSGFAEVANIPTEAIERLEVFPETVARKFGYRPDQKVVNVVTYAKFSSYAGELGYFMPTAGGNDTGLVNANYIRIRNDTRLNLNVAYDQASSLLESERAFETCVENPCLGEFRTLLASTTSVALNGTLSGTMAKGVGWSVNGRFDARKSQSLLGPGLNGAIGRETDRHNLNLGTAFAGTLGQWSWSLTGSYGRSDVSTSTTNNASAGDDVSSVDNNAKADLVLSGKVLPLPAGPIWANVHAAVTTRQFDTNSSQGGATKLVRKTALLEANIEVPITSGNTANLPKIGYLSGYVNFGIQQFSDFNTLNNFDVNLYWSPIPAINVITAYSRESKAPTIEQLGSPAIVTPNTLIYDYFQGQSVYVPVERSGNLSLRSEDRHVFSIGASITPFSETDLTFGADYQKIRINNPIMTFPIATPEAEAAFPEQFTRNPEGRLVTIDSRPLNFSRSYQQQFSWGINYTRPLEPNAKNSDVITAQNLEEIKRKFPGAKISVVESNSAVGRRIQNMSSRLTVSLYHSIYLEDRALMRQAAPTLDFLDGSAKNFLGGQPRHKVEFQASAYKRGLGGRLSANWQSDTTVNGALIGPNGNLHFAAFTTVNVDLFLDVAARIGKVKTPKWLNGVRINIGIDNLLNERQNVKDSAGFTPVNYQPAYLDPLGRSVSLTVRKVF
jgi:hypothetical protein